MDLPQELRHVYDEATSSLVASIVGPASASTRSRTAPHKIWEQVLDEDAQVLRVVEVD